MAIIVAWVGTVSSGQRGTAHPLPPSQCHQSKYLNFREIELVSSARMCYHGGYEFIQAIQLSRMPHARAMPCLITLVWCMQICLQLGDRPARTHARRLAKSLLDANWTRIIDRIQQLAVQYGRTVKLNSSTGGSQRVRHAPYAGIVMAGNRWASAHGSVPNAARSLTVIGMPLVNILDAAGLAESLNAREGDVRRRLACSGCNANAREAGTRRTPSLH